MGTIEVTHCSKRSCSPFNCLPQQAKSRTYLASNSRPRSLPKLVPRAPRLPTKLPEPAQWCGGEIDIPNDDDDAEAVAPRAAAAYDNP